MTRPDQESAPSRFTYHLPIIVTGSPNSRAAAGAAGIIAQEAQSGIEYGLDELDFLPTGATVVVGKPTPAKRPNDSPCALTRRTVRRSA